MPDVPRVVTILDAIIDAGRGLQIYSTLPDGTNPLTFANPAHKDAFVLYLGIASLPETGATTITTLGTVTTGTWHGSVIAGQYGGTGVANTGKTITLDGNLVTSGAYALTLTLTGATNVTFPTSGTLATTSDVTTAVASIVGAAPDALNTLVEISAALNDDANLYSTLAGQIALKANSADLGTAAEADIDTDPEFAANSDDLVPSQAAVRTALARRQAPAWVYTTSSLTTGDSRFTADDNPSLATLLTFGSLVTGEYSVSALAALPAGTGLMLTAPSGATSVYAVVSIAEGTAHSIAITVTAVAGNQLAWESGAHTVTFAPVGGGSSLPNVVFALETTDFSQSGTQASFTQLGTINPAITISAGSRLRVRVSGRVAETTGGSVVTRISVDGGASNVPLGRNGGHAEGITLDAEHVIAGLSAGAHTVTIEYTKPTAGILFLRGSSQPGLERLAIILEEIPN